MNKKSFLGKVALVTGGAQGIGESIVNRFLEEGAYVIIVDIDEDSYKNNFLRKNNMLFIKADLTNEKELEKIFKVISNKFNKLNILVNNAAILDATPINRLTMTRFNHVINNNLNTVLAVSLKFMNLLKSKKEINKILNISSIMGIRGSEDSIAYSTAKGGVVNLTRCLAVDLAKFKINVNTICPGFIDTRMALLLDGTGHEYDTEMFKDVYLKHRRIPLNRTGESRDISGPAFFFCSEDSDYITGQMLLVDGGLSAIF